MNKFLSLLLALCLVLSISACGQEEQAAVPTTPTEPTVPATEPSAPAESQPTQEPSQPTEPSTEPSVPTTQPTEPSTAPTEPAETTPVLWTPICQQYINLRATPGGRLLGTIPVNATLTVEKWEGSYALVTYNGVRGYVPSNYIQPASANFMAERVKVVTLSEKYTYQQMQADMAELQALYPTQVQIASIGQSELGRDIPVMRIGNPEAQYHILLQGAIHGREHFTACMLMALADHTLLKGYPSDICYHIIPMSNPDGVIISQTGVLNETQMQIYQSDLAAGYTSASVSEYARNWKANALGVDLNRNFSSGWENSLEHSAPSSEKYRGSEPFCAAEARALRDYTLQYSFDATFSIHSYGNMLYYRYGNKQPVNQQSYSLAQAVETVTGYPPIYTDGTSGAGYKDWAMDALGIPSLTVEIGADRAILDWTDFYNTFSRFENFFSAVYTWLEEN